MCDQFSKTFKQAKEDYTTPCVCQVGAYKSLLTTCTFLFSSFEWFVESVFATDEIYNKEWSIIHREVFSNKIYKGECRKREI